MAKKVVPIEEENPNLEDLNLPESEAAEEAYTFPEGLPEHIGEDSDFPPADIVDSPQDSASSEENDLLPSD